MNNFCTLFLFCFWLCLHSTYGQKKVIPVVQKNAIDLSPGFGTKVISLGDMNGDKLVDVASMNYTLQKLYIYSGTASSQIFDLSQVLDLSKYKQVPVLNNAGDINGDSFNDLIIGLPDSNKLIGFYGSANGFNSSPDLTLIKQDGKFGFSFDYSSDLNNDGMCDLVVSQPYILNFNTSIMGSVHVYYGKSTGLTSEAQLTIQKGGPKTNFGYTISPAGDVNKDGIDDILISAVRASDDLYFQPFVVCYYGDTLGINPNVSTKQWMTSSSTVDRQYGMSIGTCGDLNNDGADEIFVSTPYSKIIYPGSAKGIIGSPIIFQLNGTLVAFNTSNDFFTKAGDFNKDGFEDIALISTYIKDKVQYRKVNIFRGNKEGVEKTPWFEYTPKNLTNVLSGITSLGDYDHDGYTDLLVGEPSNTDTAPGKISILKGTFDVYAVIASDTNWFCHKDNNFKFFNKSPKIHVASDLILEGQKISLSDSVMSHTFKSSGYHNIKLTVFDLQGNSHSDSLKIFSQNLFSGGAYTLGKDKFFSGIEMLNDSLRCGIAGKVAVTLDAGVYEHPIVLKNARNEIKYPELILEGSPSSTYVSGFILDKYPNVHAKNLIMYDSIKKVNDYTRAVRIISSNNVSFDNCSFHNFLSSYLLLDAVSSKNLTVTNSKFSFFPDTLRKIVRFKKYCFAFNTAGCDSIVFIKNRIFLNYADYGMAIKGSNYLTIEQNFIQGVHNNDNKIPNESAGGIELTTVNGLRVLKNTINGCYQGMVITNCQGSENYDIIVNNEIGGDLGGTTYSTAQHGLSLIESNNLKIYHNTVHYSNDGSTSNGSSFGETYGFAFHLLKCNNIRIKNNLFVATGTPNSGSMAMDGTTSKAITSDYNVFKGIINNDNYHDNYVDLVKYSKVHHQEYNSVILKNISFKEPYLLLPNIGSDSLASQIPLLDEVKEDIMGRVRDGKRTNAGAYQLNHGDTSKTFINAGLVEIYSEKVTVGDNDINIKITNYRPEPIDSLYLHYQINGVGEVRELWTGRLLLNDTTTYTFKSKASFPTKRLFKVSAWIEFPETYLDKKKWNDTISKEFPIPMEGEYSVLCDTCFFPTLEEATYNIKRCGVETQVIFLLTSGNYVSKNLQVENGPVIYKSQSGRPEDVIISMGSMVEKSNVILRDLTLIPTFGNSLGFDIPGLCLFSCTNIQFENCNFKRGNYNTGVYIINSKSIRVSKSRFENFKDGIVFSAHGYHGNTTLDGLFTIKDNDFINIENAIVLEGKTNIPTFKLDIINNRVKGGSHSISFSRAIFSQENVNITGNYFDNNSSCIYAWNTNFSNLKITNNIIRSRNNVPIYLSAYNPAYNVDIYNNVILADSVNGVLWTHNNGYTSYLRTVIYLYNIQKVNVFHNTCKGTLRESYLTNELQVQNNIFSTKDDIDTNTFRSINPEIIKAGTPISAVYRFDIYGIERDTVHPDLGAHVIIPKQGSPILITQALTEIQETSAVFHGTIRSSGSEKIYAVGVCWSEDSIPTINDASSSIIFELPEYKLMLENLKPNKNYYARAFLTNSTGTYYGNIVSFQTQVITAVNADKIENHFSIYPNPSEGTFTIILDASQKEYDLEILNSFGSIIIKEDNLFNAGETTIKFNLKEFSPGMYFIRVISDHEIWMEKIIFK